MHLLIAIQQSLEEQIPGIAGRRELDWCRQVLEEKAILPNKDSALWRIFPMWKTLFGEIKSKSSAFVAPAMPDSAKLIVYPKQPPLNVAFMLGLIKKVTISPKHLFKPVATDQIIEGRPAYS